MSVNLTYFSPKAEKRGSDIDGRGLFAKESISKGDIVVIKGGYVMTRAERDKIGEELGPSEIQVTEDLFFGPTSLDEREGGMMHLNHSCEPNLGLQGQIVFVAIQDIAKDEELTFDCNDRRRALRNAMHLWDGKLSRSGDGAGLD